MLVKIRHTAVKVRIPSSRQVEGQDRFTGTVTYSVVGTVNGKFVRFALGTEDERVAIRRIEKIKTACAVGPSSPVWFELEDSLPRKTFEAFAKEVGYTKPVRDGSPATIPTWSNLCDIFDLEMTRLIANKQRGATRKEGILAESTRDRYRQTFSHFTAFLEDKDTPLTAISNSTIEMFKVSRMKQIEKLKQSRGGASIALDISVLHRIFAFAVEKQLIDKKPIDLRRESKPGENPKNGARSLTAQELSSLREKAGEDLFTFLFLRWTGLRGSDALNVRWKNIRFDEGMNGEVKVLTQKRDKVAIIPLSTELRNALEQVLTNRYKDKVPSDDHVLYNPETGHPFLSRKRLYERIKKLGLRAGIKRVTPHCFRDTFACDMLARGMGIFDVAMMLADDVKTVQDHYASFVPAARDAAQSKMDSGLGIEERAALNKSRGKKVAVFPSIANSA